MTAMTGTIASVAMHYERDESLSIKSCHGVKARKALGKNLRSSYNTFIGQESVLFLSNTTNQDLEVAFSVNRSSRDFSFSESKIQITAFRSIELRVHELERANKNGTLQLEL